MGPAIETGIGKDGRMQVRRTWILTTRSVMAVAGLMVLLALQPEPAGLTEVASNRAGSHARALILSDQARRYLALEYRSYPTEFMGCMIGEIHGNAVIVRRIAPADVEPGHSTATHSFVRQAYPVDAIMCGNRVVWLSRDMEQQQVQLSDPDGQPAAPPPHQRGNRVHAGAAAAEGQD